MTKIQEISDRTLFRIINEGNEFNWNLFALKVMISRLRLKLTMSKNEENAMQECLADLRDLLRRSSNIPNAKKDLLIIYEHFVEG